jgi:hypothetical protein
MNLKKILFDIVIPVGPNDLYQIEKQIEYTKKILLDIEIFFLLQNLLENV